MTRMFICNVIRTALVVGYLTLALVNQDVAGAPVAYVGAITVGLLVIAYDAWERRRRA